MKNPHFLRLIPLLFFVFVTACSDYEFDEEKLQSSGGDDLGNHTSTTDVNLNGNRLIGTAGGEGLFISPDGNIGVGTNDPEVKLDIDGTIKISAGFPGPGKVLTSDVNGVASWEDATTVAAAQANAVVIAPSNPPGGSAGDVYYNTTEERLYAHNGTAWLPTNDGGVAASVAATGVLPGTFNAGVRLQSSQLLGGINPSSQITPGALAAGVTLNTSQLSGTLNPLSQLNGGVCANGQILLSDGVNFSCANLSAAPGANLAEAIVTSATDPVGAVEGDVYYNTGDNRIYSHDGSSWSPVNNGGAAATVPATGVQAGALGAGVTLPSTQITGTLNPTTQLNGGVCANGQILQSNGTTFTCVNGSGLADNLGNHTATQNLNLATFKLVGDGGTDGLLISNAGVATFENQIQISGGNPGVNRVLTSDATGLATWTDISAVPGATRAESVTISGVDPVGALEGDVYYNTINHTLFAFDGSTWNPAGSGGAASTVPASGIQAGNIGAGVLLPTSQLTGTINPNTQIGTGALAAGVTLASTQITGTLNPTTQLNGGVCTNGQILQSNGTTFTCVNGSGLADNLGNHTAGQNLDLDTFKLVGNGGANGLLISNAGVATFENQIQISGGSPGVNRVLTSDAAGLATWTDLNAIPGSTRAESVLTSATDPVGAVEGDVYYNTTSDTLFTHDGTSWTASNTVAANNVTAGTFGVGVELPSSQLTGTLNPLTQLNGGVCTNGQILQSNGTTFTCVNGSGLADNLGNHTALQNIQLGAFYLSGDGGDEGVFVAADGDVGIGTTNPGAKFEVHEGGIRIQRTASSPFIQFVNGTTRTAQIRGLSSGGLFVATGVGGLPLMTVLETGNVGVGVTDPDAKLEVSGQVKITGGAPGANKVLTSDADGLATWETISSLPGAGDDLGNHTAGQNIILGSHYLSGDGDNEGVFVSGGGSVGIGTNNPSRSLHVLSEAGNTAAVFERTDGGGNIISLSATNSLGPGADGALAQLQYTLETETEGVIASLGALRFTAVDATAGTVDSSFTVVTLKNGVASNSLYVSEDGNVGLGVTDPDAKLEVAGQVKITGGAPGANKVLTSDADGLATWETISSLPGAGDDLGDHTATENIVLGSHYLSGDGGDEGIVVSSAGEVGIGTATPSHMLDVVGTVASNVFEVGGGTGAPPQPRVQFVESGTTDTFSINTFSGHLNFDAPVTGVGNRKMTIQSDGDVGIGTNTPAELLHLQSSFPVLRIQDGDSAGDGAQSGLEFLDSAGTVIGSLGDLNGAVDDLYVRAEGTSHLRLGANGATQILIDGSNGNVGMGVNDPDAKLEVAGQVKITGGAPGANKVLTSDADGLATWEDLPVAAGDDLGDHTATENIVMGSHYLSGDGDDEGVFVNGAGNVGIGTNSPSRSLHVFSDSSNTAATFERADGGGNIISLAATNSSGPGADGTIAQLQYTVETETEGTIASLGALRFTAVDATQGTVDSSFTVVTLKNNIATNSLHVDEDSNVGIGHANPAADLHILNGSGAEGTPALSASHHLVVQSNAAAGTNSSMAIVSGTAGDSAIHFADADDVDRGGLIYDHADDSLDIRIGAYQLFTMENGFNMGLGTADVFHTVPGSRALEVQGGHNQSPELLLNTYSNGTPTISFASQDVQTGYIRSLQSAADKDADMAFGTNNGGTVSEHMRILTTGEVGIGTTAPDTALDVGGVLELSGNGRSQISNADVANREILQLRAEQDNTLGSGINLYGDADSTNPGETRFFNSNATTMTLDASGNVGIGTTSPDTALEVQGDANNFILVSSTTTNDVGLRMSQSASNWVLGIDNSQGRSFNIQNSTGFSGGVAFTIRGANTGISDIDPDAHLEVSANGTTGGSVFMLSSDDNNDGDLMTVLESGNVGIGTDTPAGPLEVTGTGISRFIREGAAGNTFLNSLFLDRVNSSGVGAANIGTGILLRSESATEGVMSEIGQVGGRLTDATAGAEDGVLIFTTSEAGTLSEKMRILSSGNVGIGTPSPDVELDVNNGTINAASICDESNANCIDLSAGLAASSMRRLSSEPGAGLVSGDVYFNTTDNTTYFFDGTAWLPFAQSGGAAAVLTDADPAANLLSAVTGDIAFDTGSNRLQVFDGAGWEDVDGSAGDDLGDHTATQNIQLGAFYLSGDGADEGVFVDSDGKVGIGTDSPDHPLHVVGIATVNRLMLRRTSDEAGTGHVLIDNDGSITGQNNSLVVGNSSGNDGIYFTTNDGVNGAFDPKMTIESAGNVGIGTASPSELLSLNGGNLVLDDVDNGDGSASRILLVRRTAAGVNDGMSSIGTFSDGTSDGLVLSGNSNAGDGSSDHVFIEQNTGNVGIGTTAPATTLHIAGDSTGSLNTSGVDGRADMILSGGNVIAQFLSSAAAGTNTEIGLHMGRVGAESAGKITYNSASTSNTMFFHTNNAEQMRIDSSGNVGIGTPGPSALLSVNGSANKTGGGSWGVFSDARLKDASSFKDFEYGLEDALKLKPIYYRYSEDNALDLVSDKTHVGFVAQEVQKVIPDAVSENSSGYLEVNNDPIIWTILNAVKELASKVTVLVSKVADVILKVADNSKQIAEYESKLVKLKTENQDMQKRIERLENMMMKSSRMPASVLEEEK